LKLRGTLGLKIRPSSARRLSHTLLWWTLRSNSNSNKFK